MTFGDYKFPDGVEAAGWVMELLPLFIAILYPIIPLIRAYRQGFRGQELYDELFEPSDSWYRAQMERRKAAFDTSYMSNDYDNEAFDPKLELTEKKSVISKEALNEPMSAVAAPPPSYGSIKEEPAKINKIDNIKLNAAEESEIQSLNEVANDEQGLPTPIETIEVKVIEASDHEDDDVKEINTNIHSTSEEKLPPAPEVPETVEINITDADDDVEKPTKINAQNDSSKN